ncbi:alkaline phosphatase D family protein [Pandoraea capi]|uniref:alkaline phosphatase D family protein n=1 Tax=Pandoraea capi TaxID=2508286 RepID=UPI00158233EF|nr:alkaline phosphatase D family protein [Pandoraea capi]
MSGAFAQEDVDGGLAERLRRDRHGRQRRLQQRRQLDIADRSMLGQGQELWLADRLQKTTAQWNVVASTVKMTPFDMRHNGELYRYLQSWARRSAPCGPSRWPGQ